MEDILTRILENSITLSIMLVVWRMAESRANSERERVKTVSEKYIDFLQDEVKRKRVE